MLKELLRLDRGVVVHQALRKTYVLLPWVGLGTVEEPTSSALVVLDNMTLQALAKDVGSRVAERRLPARFLIPRSMKESALPIEIGNWTVLITGPLLALWKMREEDIGGNTTLGKVQGFSLFGSELPTVGSRFRCPMSRTLIVDLGCC